MYPLEELLMHEGGGGFRETRQNTETPESKESSSEKLQNSLEKIASKINELFSDDVRDDNDSKNDAADRSDNSSEKESLENKSQDSENATTSFKELFDRLFSDDFFDIFSDVDNTSESDESESDIDKRDAILKRIEESISTPEGIKELIEKHPEKAELWKSQLEALDTLNDPDASPAEIRSAQAKLSILKGQLMEVAVKDALTEAGFDVEAQQRVVEGESGGTRPDVIAVNNTDHPIEVFGIIFNLVKHFPLNANAEHPRT